MDMLQYIWQPRWSLSCISYRRYRNLPWHLPWNPNQVQLRQGLYLPRMDSLCMFHFPSFLLVHYNAILEILGRYPISWSVAFRCRPRSLAWYLVSLCDERSFDWFLWTNYPLVKRIKRSSQLHQREERCPRTRRTRDWRDRTRRGSREDSVRLS